MAEETPVPSITRGSAGFGSGAALIFCAAIAVAGCEAEMVTTRRKVQGPVAAVGLIDAGGGETKYGLWGPTFMIRSRRQDALEKIAEFCGGSGAFKIVDEVERSDMETPYSTGDIEDDVASGGRHYRKVRYHHVFFECLKR